MSSLTTSINLFFLPLLQWQCCGEGEHGGISPNPPPQKKKNPPLFFLLFSFGPRNEGFFGACPYFNPPPPPIKNPGATITLLIPDNSILTILHHSNFNPNVEILSSCITFSIILCSAFLWFFVSISFNVIISVYLVNLVFVFISDCNENKLFG